MKRTSNWRKAPVVIFVRAPLMLALGLLVILSRCVEQAWLWVDDNLPGFD